MADWYEKQLVAKEEEREEMMAKLHELLAVENDLKAEAQRVVNSISSLFTQKQAQLVGQIRTYQPLEDNGERFADERQQLATSVYKQLVMLEKAYGSWLDVALQKEVTNSDTSADIIVDDAVLVGGLPAPALLNLESKLAELRKLYAAIPINDAAETWVWDEDSECFRSMPRTTYKTKKVPKSFVAYEATEQHPAQVQVFNEDVRVGEWTTVVFSGAVSHSRKRGMLERIDRLSRAVKQARQRANGTEADSLALADRLFAYINGE